MVLKRFIELALLATIMLLPLTVYAPMIKADFTHIIDDTYPEIGWVDVEQVGWDVVRGITSDVLIIEVKYQESLPPCTVCPCDYTFGGNFYLDTDRDPTTGSPHDEFLTTTPRGTDYFISFAHLGSWSCSSLHEWDDIALNWVNVGELETPTLNFPTNDTVTLTVPLADINSPTSIDIVFKSYCDFTDWGSIPASLAIYDIDSEDYSIWVDGDPASIMRYDWRDDTPDVTDPTGDTTPGWADATTFYITDESDRILYMRLDFAEPPLRLHPEERSIVRQRVGVLIDYDQDNRTGFGWFGIGAEYELKSFIDTGHTSQDLRFSFLSWNPALEEFEVDYSATTEIALDACLEYSILLSDLGVGITHVPIYMNSIYTMAYDRVPNTGTFTVDTSSPTMKTFLYVPYMVLIAAVVVLTFLVRRFLIRRKDRSKCTVKEKKRN